jgi:hypothetical protein
VAFVQVVSTREQSYIPFSFGGAAPPGSADGRRRAGGCAGLLGPWCWGVVRGGSVSDRCSYRRKPDSGRTCLAEAGQDCPKLASRLRPQLWPHPFRCLPLISSAKQPRRWGSVARWRCAACGARPCFACMTRSRLTQLMRETFSLSPSFSFSLSLSDLSACVAGSL